MLIVVNVILPMFSFCKLLYLYMFRCGAREAVRVFLVFPQIAQICTDAVRGRANPTDRAQARQMPQMPFGVSACFPHRLRRWRQGASVSFVTMLHVTCYNKVVPYCAGWALRNYIVYILYI